jgi:Cu(I)/Ag(I) efflux system membrane fusion protein/cobalt-zinc-cadmium efflux system membrane fusion protein
MKTTIMKTQSIFILTVLLIIFAGGGYWAGTQFSSSNATHSPSNNEEAAAGKTTSPQQNEKGQTEEREILYWQAPMNPSEIYEKPGKSNMGMDLVPVYADEASGSEGMVSINPVIQQNMNVRTAKVMKKEFFTTINAFGNITYDERKLYNVNPKISGWIDRLYVDYTGKMVQKGQPLFALYSPELVTTQQEYLLALKAKDKLKNSSFTPIREGGQSLLEATRKRLEYWDIPEAEIKRLEDTGEISKTITLNAPATGMVLHKNAVEGEYIKAGTSTYKIANLSTVWVQAHVYDYEIPWVKKGQKAIMSLSYQPGKTYTGTVDFIYPNLKEQTRTVQVRLKFPNPNLELKPGMFANVQLQSRPKQNVTVIPSEAIIRTGERNIVFVAKGEGMFEPREVILGMDGGERNNEVEVLSGVHVGEQIVTSAQFLFDSESRLQEAIQKMLDQNKSSHSEMDHSNMDSKHSTETHTTMEHENLSDSDMNHEMHTAESTIPAQINR